MELIDQRLKVRYTKEDAANKHVRTHSASLIIREMQSKDTRYHYTSIRMATIEKMAMSAIPEEDMGQPELSHTLG